MEKLKAIRGGHRSAVTRLINRTKERISENDIELQELSAAADTLTKKRNLLESLDSQILDGTELEDMEQEILDVDEYTMNMEVTIHRFKDIVSGNKTTPFQQTVSETTYVPIENTLANHNSNHSENVFSVENNSVYSNANPTTTTNFYHKLPKLDLQNCTGDILTWQTFWESFEITIHHNPSLTNVQKFSYLKSQIHSEAAQCISGLSLSNANYDHAIILLKERYGQTQTIINAYMQNLLELTHPSLTPHSIRAFYDKMESCIRGLESLGQSQDTFGSLLVPIIFGKLPDEMKKLMTREHGKQNWDIRSLREAIGKEMYVQETGNSDKLDSFTPTASFHTAVEPKITARPQSVTNQFKPKTCIYCKQSHSSLECTNVVDRESRLAIIKQNKVCYNCLGNHKVSECHSRFRYRNCNSKHHTSFCDRNENQERENVSTMKPLPQNTSVNTVESNNDTVTFYTSTSSVKTSTDVLLKTAISPVCVDDRSATANILLDEGSQKSFISKELATELQLKPNGTSTISVAAFGDAHRNVRNLDTAIIDLQTQNGRKIPMEVLIVPTIAAPLHNRMTYNAAKLPYLSGLRFAHPVSDMDKFKISLLIGSDYFWDIVEDKIIRGPGPTAVESKLGYLLSGPMKDSAGPTSSAFMIQHKTEEVDLERFKKRNHSEKLLANQ
ncbi:uncharacterized protein LOC127724889 [Mytilus californianus]|uniref:uncharacterized protein LOC127724889 n=1 Tax=Mytilus californianus TaxID=6549 RepID=UPI0022483B35|nr:uncharacterized protein LOC127724889 [Mytilus californianus]